MPIPASCAISIDVNAYRKKVQERAARREDRIAAPWPRWHLTARKQFYFPRNLSQRKSAAIQPTAVFCSHTAAHGIHIDLLMSQFGRLNWQKIKPERKMHSSLPLSLPKLAHPE